MTRHLEDTHQIALINWCRLQKIPGQPYTLADLIFHIPNGGNRNKREAARFKKMGVKAGVSDLFLPVAKGPYHGLWIEFKAPIERGKPKPKTSKSQKEWLLKMGHFDYEIKVCYGWEHAKQDIMEYINRE